MWPAVSMTKPEPDAALPPPCAVEGERAVAAAGGDEDDAAGDLLVDVGDAGGRGVGEAGEVDCGRRSSVGDGRALDLVGERADDGEHGHDDADRDGAEQH